MNVNDEGAVDLQKMIFIYNAVQNGWKVKKMSEDKYIFKKSKDEASREVYLDEYVSNFLKNNVSIDNIFQSS